MATSTAAPLSPSPLAAAAAAPNAHHGGGGGERPLWRKLLGLFSEKDVPPGRVEGSVVVVTGANSGVGLEICKALARCGAGAIFCLGRDEGRLREACAELEKIALDSARSRLEAFQQRASLGASSAAAAAAIAVTALAPTQLIPLVCDLESAGEVARCAFSIEARAPHVDYLVLCAGRYVDAPFHLAHGWGPHAAPAGSSAAAGGGGGGSGGGAEEGGERAAEGEVEGPEWAAGGPEEKKKAWGIESTLAANFYGHALLASMLMPKLLLRAQDMLAQGALHRPAPPPEAAQATAPAVAAASPAPSPAPSPAAPKPFSAAETSAAEQPRSAPVLAPGTGTVVPAPAATTPPQHAHGITAVTGRAAAAQRGPSGHSAGPAAVRLPLGSRPLPRARVVWVASQAEQYAPALGRFLVEDPTGERLGTGGMAAYARSKAMGIIFVRELARRLALGQAHASAAREAAVLGGDQRRAQAPAPRPVDAIACHPGLVDSPLMDRTSPREYPITALLSRAGAALIGITPRQGAMSVLFALTSPELDSASGAFVGPSYLHNLIVAPREPAHPDARDPDVWQLNWEATRRVLLRSFRASGRVASRLHAVLGGHHRALPSCA